MITDQEQLAVALGQLAGFKDLLEAMRRHLEETEPTLLPTVAVGYEHRIRQLQDEICEFLLRERAISTDAEARTLTVEV